MDLRFGEVRSQERPEQRPRVEDDRINKRMCEAAEAEGEQAQVAGAGGDEPGDDQDERQQ